MEKMYTNDCITNLPFVFIARPSDPGNGNLRIVMLEITEEEENLLDKRRVVEKTINGVDFSINYDYCMAYGELDLSPNSKDIEDLNTMSIFHCMNIRQFMPSKYDYETHTVTSNLKTGKWYDTSNPKTYLPYLYACLNKPKRIAIFKESVSKIFLQREKRKAKQKSHSSKSYIQYKKNKIAKAKLANVIFALKS